MNERNVSGAQWREPDSPSTYIWCLILEALMCDIAQQLYSEEAEKATF